MEHGNYRQHRVAGTQIQGIGQCPGEGMQDRGAVAVQNAFGVAGRAAGVAQARCRVFIKHRPVVLRGLGLYQRFVTVQIRDAAVGWQFVGVAERDVMLNGAAAVVDGFDDGQKRHVKTQHLVLGVVGNPDNLVRVQARVQRVQNPP